MGHHAAAEDSLTEALTVARRQSAKFWELRVATSLAALWRDQERGKEARDLLAPVYGWFTDGFDTPVLNEAKSILDQLPGGQGGRVAEIARCYLVRFKWLPTLHRPLGPADWILRTPNGFQ
jgi:hypothetical protein